MRKFLLLFAALALATPVHAKATCQTKPVVMFMTSWCPYCRAATAFFREEQVDFESIDVERSADPRIQTMYKGHAYGVPYIIVEGKTVSGFDEQSLRDALCVKD